MGNIGNQNEQGAGGGYMRLHAQTEVAAGQGWLWAADWIKLSLLLMQQQGHGPAPCNGVRKMPTAESWI